MAKGKYEYWLSPDGLLLMEGWARDGLTDEQIAHNMGINRDTLYTWKKRFPVISDTLKKSKEVVDLMVENALLKNAMEGNLTAQIFWLKNRKPDRWRDRPQSAADNEEQKIRIERAKLAKAQEAGEVDTGKGSIHSFIKAVNPDPEALKGLFDDET